LLLVRMSQNMCFPCKCLYMSSTVFTKLEQLYHLTQTAVWCAPQICVVPISNLCAVMSIADLRDVSGCYYLVLHPSTVCGLKNCAQVFCCVVRSPGCISTTEICRDKFTVHMGLFCYKMFLFV